MNALLPAAAAFSTALLFAAASSAQDWDCTDAGNLPQQGMNMCAHKDFERADRALNVAWKGAWGDVQKTKGQVHPLLQAQRAWIAYRESQCEAEGRSFEGGSLQPFIISSCMARMTRQRTEELLIYQDK